MDACGDRGKDHDVQGGHRPQDQPQEAEKHRDNRSKWPGCIKTLSRTAGLKRWRLRAERHGFADEYEMLECLCRDQSIKSIAWLLGLHYTTVRARIIMHGLDRNRSRGGRNHTRALTGQRKIMETMEEYDEWFDLIYG